jgi:hypothetical protein
MKFLLPLGWLLLITLRGWLKNTLISLDLLLSAMTGGLPGETLSGRAGAAWMQKTLRGRIFCPVIDVIMHLCRAYPTWRGHCVHAATVGDPARARAVLETRV